MTTEPWLNHEIRVNEALVRVLVESGIDMVFGVPGGDSWMVFDGLYDQQHAIRTVTVREESLAAVMAEVYGRLTGRPGVVLAQGAWVLSNSLLGTLEAHLSSSPMILLTDLTDGGVFSHHGPYQSGAGAYGAFDLKQALEGVTKATMLALDGVQAVQLLQLAIKHATTGEPGPVALLMHSGAIKAKVGPASRPRLYPTVRYLPQPPSAPADTVVAEVAGLIASAHFPVVLAGNGVRLSRAYKELAMLAEAYRLPVVTSAGGKGVFDERSEFALGVCGTFGRPAANAALSAADVVLVLGSKLAPGDTANENPRLIDPGRQTIAQVDVEPRNAAWTFPVDLPVIGDVGATLRGVLAAGKDDRPSTGVLQSREAAISSLKQEHGWFDVPASFSDEVPLLPERIIKILHEAIPDNAIVTCDAGENRLFMMHYFQSKQPGNYLQPAGIGGMGYAIPAALGAKLVFPDRPVVAVCGDGGFGMSMNGLMTAHEESIPIVVLVLNNAAFGWVYHGQGDRRISATLGSYDHGAVARALGCEGVRIETTEELRAALGAALLGGKPTVIDAITALDDEHSFLQITSPLSRGY